MATTTLCQRCTTVLLPLVGSRGGEHAPEVGRAVAAHGRLVRHGWRSSYPQEGAEYLYRCEVCGAWWGHGVWSCLPQEDLARC